MATIQHQAWLSQINFNDEIGDVPVSFDVIGRLSVHARKIMNGWLLELISSDTVLEIQNIFYDQNGNGSVDLITGVNKEYFDLIMPFLANAIWSEYILHGNVNITDTGPVQKRDSQGATEPITDRQRTELSRSYKAYANDYALKLSTKVNAGSGVCGDSSGSQSVSLSTVRGARRSRFDTYSRRDCKGRRYN
ncbi:hypothetical protein IC229_27440 [Spirosoma sp. BT702]|uniref:Uncharacterized protein n=1 Tax=Spirosoma profusum TaxID=2771354 RepID=A0A926Y5A3_9BACT|nr:hypothetical protein [Spirosoma profusum]MBD2704405.1 hypothetical protein [Spirosoma profusum]